MEKLRISPNLLRKPGHHPCGIHKEDYSIIGNAEVPGFVELRRNYIRMNVVDAATVLVLL